MSEVLVTPQVEYRSIPGFPDYRAGDDGSVWSKRLCGEWRKLKCSKNNTGYRAADLINSRGKKKTVQVHKLVMLAFVGKRPTGKQTRHLNSNRFDNRPSNLKYGTAFENRQDAVESGALIKCLNEDQLKEATRRFDAGESIATMSAAMHINQTCLRTRLSRNPYYRDRIWGTKVR